MPKSRPFIYCGACLVITLAIGLFAGAMTGLVALIVSMGVMNYVNTGSLNFRFSPRNGSCLSAQVGTLPCFVAELLMSLLGIILLGLIYQAQGGM